jgi:anti-sigma regulatory factor (Ser/Thr protein kinase)
MGAASWTRRFPRNVGALDAVFAFVDDFLNHAGLAADSAHDAGLVLEEIFTNLVRHNRGAQEIEIAMSLEGPDLVMTVRDFDVDRFDPTAVAEAPADGNPGSLSPGGRGITLVKRLTKEFRYHYADRTSTLTTRLGAVRAQEP